VGNHVKKKRRELKHLSTFRKRNQPRFRKYWRKKAEETNQRIKQPEQGGILDQRWWKSSIFVYRW